MNEVVNSPVEDTPIRADVNDTETLESTKTIKINEAEKNIHGFSAELEKNALNADKLNKTFSKKEAEEYTKIDGWYENIKLVRNCLNPLLEKINSENKDITDPEDIAWLNKLDEFLNTCLLNNEQIQAVNKTITQMLNKLDNRGEWRKINIDEKKIDLKSARIDWDKVNLEYNLDGNTIKIALGAVLDGWFSPVEWKSSITIPDKNWKDQYFKIVPDDKWWLELVPDADWLLNKLAWYNVTWDAKEWAKVTKEWTWYRVEMKNNIDDSLISFILDENWESRYADKKASRQEQVNNEGNISNYIISIGKNTFEIKDKNAVEKKAKIEALKKQEENEIIKNLEFDYIADQKINALKIDQDKEAQRPNWEWLNKAKDIQIQIKTLQENKENYKNILTKITEIDTKITQIDLDIKAKVNKEDFDWAIILNLQKQELEWQKSKIQDLEWKMKKQASEDQRADVTKTWKDIDALINPPQAATAVGEAATTSTETAATGLTEKSVIDAIDNEELKGWYTKEWSKNKLEEIIGLLKIEDKDLPDIQTIKTDLSMLLADWDMVGFQEKLGLKKWFNADQTDGKLGKYTLDIVTKRLTTETGGATAGAVE